MTLFELYSQADRTKFFQCDRGVNMDARSALILGDRFGRMLMVFLSGLATALLFPSQMEYHSPARIGEWLQTHKGIHGEVMNVEVLATSPGNRPVFLVRIAGKGTGDPTDRPAVLVVANPSGHLPIASESALGLIEYLLADPVRYRDTSWYVVPSLNPDAHDAFFAPCRTLVRVNDRPVNDDRDDLEDEDPVDDLNGDGFITQMRVVDPEGQWVAVEGEPRLMRKKDFLKGEKGVFRLYQEGLDNDRDGMINEDGRGGVDLGINFPHLFPDRLPHAGDWPGSESETFELIRFATAHREIAMTLVLGETNFCYKPPRSDRKSRTDFSKIKVPEEIGRRLGLDSSRTYTLQEIVTATRETDQPEMKLRGAMVVPLLGLGPVVNPLPEDLVFYEEITRKYRKFLREKGIPVERHDPRKALDGSFELWSYYQLGLPSFSLDCWWIPKKEKKKTDVTETPKTDDGKETCGPDPVEESLLHFCDANPEEQGFVPWTKSSHPLFGEVEIGGFVPYFDQNPPRKDIDGAVESQLSWIVELAAKRASLAIHSSRVVEEGAGLFRISTWIENRGLLPYPTAMGACNGRTKPIFVVLDGEGIEYLSGRKRERIYSVGGHSTRKIEWLIRSKKPQRLRISMSSDYAGGAVSFVRVGGAS